MKAKFLTLLITFTILVACKENQKSAEINPDFSRIENLKSDHEKSTYLYELWQEDQGLRTGKEKEIAEKYGFDEAAQKANANLFFEIDQSVFQRMKKYLETHGYPDHPENYHELAINAFPIIIGHHHNYEAQKELFPYLYTAYQNKKCTLDDVVWVMHEMYESKNRGVHYKIKADRFTTEVEFKELNEVLDLGLTL